MDNLEIISQIDHRFEMEIKTYSEYIHDSKSIRVYIANGEAERLNDFLESFRMSSDTLPKLKYNSPSA